MAPDWDNFAVIAGGAAGALTRLLFVAVSLNRERVAGHRGLRAQAGQTLVLFALPLLLSILMTVPGLSAVVFGTGLILLALVAGGALVLIGREGYPAARGDAPGGPPAGDSPADRLARLLDRVSPNLVVVVLVLVAGCLQLAGDDGLYWVAGAATVALVGGVTNAWLFLTRG